VKRLSLTSVAALLAVIVLAPSGAGAAASRAPLASKSATTTAIIYDQGFTPPLMRIRKNGSVKWKWDSSNQYNHSVLQNKGPRGSKAFISKTRSKNYSYTHKFLTSGTYIVLCTIHPGYQQTIIVR
jgi:plastocyanin